MTSASSSRRGFQRYTPTPTEGATLTVESVIDRIFRSETVTEGKVAGTGLGLYLCRRYVQLMQGDIKVDSQLGRGATFTIRLPGRVSPLPREATRVEAKLRAAGE